MRPDPHPEIAGTTVACTCHSFGTKMAAPLPPVAYPPRGTDLAVATPPVAYPARTEGLTAADAVVLEEKEVG